MKETKLSQLTLHGNVYDLNAVLRLAPTGPLVECQITDFNTNVNPDHVVTYQSAQPGKMYEAAKSNSSLPCIVIYKQDGKYTILHGHELLAEQQKAKGFKAYKCRLLSHPMLKKARIDADPTSSKFVGMMATTGVREVDGHQERVPLRPDLRDHRPFQPSRFPAEFANTPRVIDTRQRNDQNRARGYGNAPNQGVRRRPEEDKTPVAGSFVDHAIRAAGLGERVI